LDPSVIDGAVSAIGAAAGAYGQAVLTAAEDAAATSTVRLGQRLLTMFRHRASNGGQFDAAVLDAAAHPGDPDFRVSLRAQIRKVLEANPGLAADLTALLAADGNILAAGDRAVAIQRNEGIVSTGDGTVNIVSKS
jgi:hypothetical protein